MKGISVVSLITICFITILTGDVKHANSAVVSPGISYANPPNRVVWIQGVNCQDSNFTGRTGAHNWWYGLYPSVNKRGLFAVTSWRLPNGGNGFYYARYHFNLPSAGTYVLYFRGRYPGYFASPITWQINNGPEHSQPPTGKEYFTNVLADALTLNRTGGEPGLALVKLGTFHGKKGANTVTIRVRQFETGNELGVPHCLDKKQWF
jgi:hypothetical protein